MEHVVADDHHCDGEEEGHEVARVVPLVDDAAATHKSIGSLEVVDVDALKVERVEAA